MYLYREYFKARVYNIWVHGPLEVVFAFFLAQLNEAWLSWSWQQELSIVVPWHAQWADGDLLPCLFPQS